MKRLAHPSTILTTPDGADRPQGVTLTEVLVSILIMSIGVVSVASMFPIAVLRSVQANTLTNATILKTNAEALAEVMPGLIHDPDGIDNVNPGDRFAEHFMVSANRRYVVDPLGAAYAAIDGRDATTLGGTANNNRPVNRFLGFSFNNDPAAVDAGGNAIPLFPDLNGDGSIDAFDVEMQAASLVTLPDSWDTLVDGEPTQVNIDSNGTYVELPAALDADFTGIAPQDLQVYLYDEAANIVEARRMLNLNGNKVYIDSLPPSMTNVTRVRVDVRARKYTWLLTIRKSPDGVANGNIVIFFKRSFSAEDETLHAATFTPGSPVVNVVPTPGAEPLVRGGGYILDAENLRWYRIQEVLSESETLIQLQLARPAVEASTTATLMRGIVAVFPMNTRGL